MSDNWLVKYCPKSSSEILGDPDQIETLDKFFKQFSTKSHDHIYPNMIITGKNGTGKSLVVDLILKENDYEKATPNLLNINIKKKTKKCNAKKKEQSGNDKCIESYYMSFNRSKVMNGDNGKISLVKSKKVAIVFDDVSNTISPREKEIIKLLFKINNKKKLFPLIIISDGRHNKFIINDIGKMVTYKKKNKIKFYNKIMWRGASYDQLKKFIDQVAKSESLNLYRIHKELIDYSRYDLRKLINLLQDLKAMYKNNKITKDIFSNYATTALAKTVDPGIFETTKKMLNHYGGVKATLESYSTERAATPLVLHENYTSNIKLQYPKMSKQDQCDLLFNVSKHISNADTVDGAIYSNQLWSLQETHGFYSCVYPSYLVNSYPNKMCFNEPIEYTKIFNKTSVSKINNKTAKNVQSKRYNALIGKCAVINNWSVDDVGFLSQILAAIYIREYNKQKLLSKSESTNKKKKNIVKNSPELQKIIDEYKLWNNKKIQESIKKKTVKDLDDGKEEYIESIINIDKMTNIPIPAKNKKNTLNTTDPDDEMSESDS